ncbi:MAG: TolC family protein [Candidatus Zixiibacteriota bacterium]
MRQVGWLAGLLAAILVLPSAKPGIAQQLSLEDALKIAGRNAPTTQIARHQVIAANARVKAAESAFYPQFGINSSYVSSDNPVQAFMFALNQRKFSLSSDVNNPPRADNWQLSIQGGINLFSGGSSISNRRAARYALDGQTSMERATANEVALQVIGAYLAVLTAQESKRASEAATNSYAVAESVSAARVEAGTALKTDLLNIQVQRIQSEERQLRADNEMTLAKERLRFALGLEALPYHEFSSIDQVKLIEVDVEAPSTRPELEARTAFAKAARSELSAARGSYLPSVNLFASADRYQGWEFDGTGDDWTIGVRAHWAVFDGFLTRANVREKSAQFQIAEEEARMAKMQMDLELTTARSSVAEATQRVAVMTKAAALASESAVLTRQRFEQGLLITSQVIDAENVLVQAEVGLVQAKADRLKAIALLRRALNLSIVGE